MQVTKPAIVEQSKGGIATLLNFGNDETRANAVDCSGRHDKRITCPDPLTLYQIGNAAIYDRGPQVRRRNAAP
jgi:hypothetical protein